MLLWYNNLPMRRGRPTLKVVKEIKEEQNYFQVEKILRKRFYKGKIEYLIKWEGFDQGQATWEKESNLAAVQDMIEEFDQSINPKEIIKAAFQSQEQTPNVADLVRSTTQSNQLIEEKSDQLNKDETTYLLKDLEVEAVAGMNIVQTPFDVPKKQPIQQNDLYFGEKQHSNERILDNTEIDISLEAKQMGARFQKLAQKFAFGKAGKKEQKEQKKKIKRLERELSRPVTQFLPQENLNGNFNLPQKEGYRRHLRERKQKNNTPPTNKAKMPHKHKEKLTEENQQSSHSKNQIILKKEQTPQKEIRNSKSAKKYNYTNQLNRAVIKNLSEKNSPIVSIRMLENQPNKLAEYLVQYDSGELKIFKTTQLIVSHPIEFAQYLDKKHRI